jgi:sterol desaturase/sphingolipid hydroxylase (fatty acid hydroxylase superfamily)
LYLSAALVLAVGVGVGSGLGRKGGFIRRALRFCLPKSIYGHKSAVMDYKYLIVNGISYGLLFAPLALGSPVVARWTANILEEIYSTWSLELVAGPFVGVLLTVAWVLAFDAGVFLAHILQHKIPVLWEFHKIHHSAEVLTPITVYRNHPVDDLFAGSMIALLTGIVRGAFVFVYPYGIEEVLINGLNIVLFVFYVTGANLRHSHIWLPYPRALRYVLISPVQHQIHHSADPKHFDKNYGFMLAYWDILAGSLDVPEGREELKFGLYDGEHGEYDTLLRLYFLPFRKISTRVRRAVGWNP